MPALEPADVLSAARAGFAGAAPEESEGDGAARARLWRAGNHIAEAEASAADGLTAAQAAGAALREAIGDQSDQPGDALGIEVEANREPRTPEGLIGLIQTPLPGHHGLILRDGDHLARGWPFDALRTEGRTPAWVKRLNRQARHPGARLASSTAVETFTTVEALGTVAPTVGERITPRSGGFRLVDIGEVLPDRLSGRRSRRQPGSFATNEPTAPLLTSTHRRAPARRAVGRRTTSSCVNAAAPGRLRWWHG